MASSVTFNVPEAVRVTGAVKPTVALPKPLSCHEEECSRSAGICHSKKKMYPRIGVEIVLVLKLLFWQTIE